MKSRTGPGPLLRLGLVVAYGLGAFLLAHLVSGQRSGIPAGSTPIREPTDEQSLELKVAIQASRPVTNWLITLDGASLEATTSTPLTWTGQGQVEIQTGTRLILDVIPEEAQVESPLAVRIDLDCAVGSLTRTFWSSGDLVEAVLLDSLRPTPEETL